MRKLLLMPILTVLIVFSMVAWPSGSVRAMAAQACNSAGQAPGFRVAGQTWGSVVTLCATFVADRTATSIDKKPQPLQQTKPNKTVSFAKPLPKDPLLSIKLRHRLLARRGGNNFSPTQLVILSSLNSVRPNQTVHLKVGHKRQFRTAYLLGRFVALRFSPLRIDFHFDHQTNGRGSPKDSFGASAKFASAGYHTVRGIVTYLAEFRVNGQKQWMPVSGSPMLAAVPARILVSKNAEQAPNTDKSGNRAYLVSSDCLYQIEKFGCLN